jgi:single-strand DNA-binding protein
MTKGLNKVQLIGRLGATPEMRYTPQGNAVTTFRIAVDRVWKDMRGEQQTETDWFRIVAWKTLAEHCNQFLDVGRLVYIEGRLQIRAWEDQHNQTRHITEIVAQDVIFLDGRRDADGPADDGDAEDAEATAPAPRQMANSPGHARRSSATARVAASRHPKGAVGEENLPL